MKGCSIKINELKTLLLKYRRVFIIAVHFILIVTAYFLAFCFRFDFSIPPQYYLIYLKTFPLLAMAKLIVFYYFGIFHGLWRYVGMSDIVQILNGNIVVSVLSVIEVLFVFRFNDFPRSIFALDFILCVFLILGIRFITRLIRERYIPNKAKKTKKVLIVGAGESGILTLTEYSRNPGLAIEVVGFIDDDRIKKYSTIHGVKILGNRNDIPQIVERFEVNEIVLAMPSAKGEDIRNIVLHCQIPDVKVKIVPPLNKIISGELTSTPREVRPEDLLGRETTTIFETDIERYIKNKRILVTGAGGSIGSELCRQIINFSPEKIILFDHNENDVYFLQVEFKIKFRHIKFRTIIGDIQDIGLLKHVFSTYRPDVIFHAAAHKHVPLMENNPIIAVKNNVIGTRNLIYAAAHYGLERFVLISTDKAVNPTSIMGATKRIAEMLLQAKSKKSRTKFMAVRFGNVIGSDGSVVPLFKKQIEEGGPITVTHPEVKRYFMSVKEAASLVLQAGAMGGGGEIFILDMGEQIKIYDLAKNLITLSGLTLGKDISIEFIGLRPGEKMHEEMLLDSENDTVTKHNKIYITKRADYDPAKLRKKIREMEYFINLMDEKKVIQLIFELVNTYSPSKGKTGVKLS
jgi:FlaA1/EpsC-like NDP-sugar epimerase